MSKKSAYCAQCRRYTTASDTNACTVCQARFPVKRSYARVLFQFRAIKLGAMLHKECSNCTHSTHPCGICGKDGVTDHIYIKTEDIPSEIHSGEVAFDLCEDCTRRMADDLIQGGRR